MIVYVVKHIWSCIYVNLMLLLLLLLLLLIITISIHRMIIWRTTRSSPGTSYMKVRLVSLWSFVLTMLPQETLALLSICSVLFCYAYDLLCFRMQQERIEIFHHSPLRENSGSTQFVVTRKRGSRWPRELTFVCYISGRRSQKNCLNGMLMWCLVVFQHDFHGQYLPQAKEKLFLSDILCLKGRYYLPLHPLAQNHTKQIRQCNNQANEL